MDGLLQEVECYNPTEQSSMNVNTGGRVTFQQNAEVRILCSDGRISREIYEVDSEKSDRKGHVTLKEKGTTRMVKIQFRRIIPVNVDGQAAVIESAGKFRAVCPNCNYVEMITAVSDHLSCPSHGQFQLYWLGVKPMAESTVEKKATKEKASTKKSAENQAEKPEKKAEKKPQAEKAPKVVRQPATVDLNELAGRENCELWTRKDVKFDHERISVESHTLLFTGSQPRKFCFNTYNNALGKRAEPLPIEEFIHDKAVKNTKKPKPWYAVADLDKARAKLQKDGYELQSKA